MMRLDVEIILSRLRPMARMSQMMQLRLKGLLIKITALKTIDLE